MESQKGIKCIYVVCKDDKGIMACLTMYKDVPWLAFRLEDTEAMETFRPSELIDLRVTAPNHDFIFVPVQEDK